MYVYDIKIKKSINMKTKSYFTRNFAVFRNLSPLICKT